MGWIIRHNEMIQEYVTTACGSQAVFDDASGIGYRCMECGAMLGSIGMPKVCFDLEEERAAKEKMWKALSNESKARNR